MLIKSADGSGTEYTAHTAIIGNATQTLNITGQTLEQGKKYIVTLEHNGEKIDRQIEVPAAAGGLEITGPDPSIVIEKGTMVLEGKGVALRPLQISVNVGPWIPSSV